MSGFEDLAKALQSLGEKPEEIPQNIKDLMSSLVKEDKSDVKAGIKPTSTYVNPPRLPFFSGKDKNVINMNETLQDDVSAVADFIPPVPASVVTRTRLRQSAEQPSPEPSDYESSDEELDVLVRLDYDIPQYHMDPILQDMDTPVQNDTELDGDAHSTATGASGDDSDVQSTVGSASGDQQDEIETQPEPVVIPLPPVPVPRRSTRIRLEPEWMRSVHIVSYKGNKLRGSPGEVVSPSHISIMTLQYAYKYIHLPHLRHCGNVV
ncbi:unnamed protein product [Mytilus edulis]|uniref:Uncharacterized protein n=1 Tax=Mytilus edulis TaxID=6550 RepID=A0A8S3PSD9_MYTED|nr:unnamed protein product [Mytilus edulis]